MEPAALARVLGVDDWAKRKGQNYGTILVDLERGEIVDLLADRTAETLVEWLKKHPGIEIVTRDRSQTYADAIQKGAPEAIQVADRWHLLKNLSDVVFRILQQEYGAIKKRLAHEEEASGDGGKEMSGATPTVELEALTLAEQRRKERIELALHLNGQGWTQKDIAHHLNIHPKTVRRYLRTPSPQTRRHRTGRLLDAFKPYILKRWNEGCHNAAQLFREIHEQGFAGKPTTVRDFVRQLRQASGLPPKARRQKGKSLGANLARRPPTLRSLTWSIVRRPEERTVDDERLLTQLSDGDAKLTATIELARGFAAIVREQQAEKLNEWLEQARQSGFRIWSNFAAGLDQDYDAVRAALTLNWSNGPTEGHINRLKCLKRQMYGRAKDDLLRKRVLWQGRWSFT
jgi:transposase